MPLGIYFLGLALLTAAGAVLRAVWLDHPMRYDESWGFLEYILPRSISACLVYSAPNNHVLHTLLVAVASWLGGDSPAVLRMPAFLAGVALIPATGHLATVMGGRRIAGLMAAAFVACSSILVEYSVNSRGYTMFCLAAVLLAERTARICRNVRPLGPWLDWMVIAAAGLFTIPIMLYPMIVLSAAIVLQAFLGPADRAARRLALRRTMMFFVMAIGVAFLLYLSVFHATGLVATQENPRVRQSPLVVYGSGLYALVANPFVEPKSLGESVAGLPRVAAEALADWTRDLSPLGWALAAAGLLAATVVGLYRRRVLYLLPLLLPVVLAGLMLLQRVVPFARVWLFALPLLLAVASCGLAELVCRINPGRLRTMVLAVALLAALAVAVHAAWRVARPGRAVLGECCLIDARAIVTDTLELADGRTSLAWNYEVPNWPPLAYYMVTFARPQRHFVPYLGADCRRVLVVVPAGQTLQSVLDHRPRLAEAYGPMQPWRSYPSAEVFIAWRKPTTAPSAKSY
jgi:hypothetical protein